jgi:protein-S-isoprenylcysteine O-methyltransferase Ste14
MHRPAFGALGLATRGLSCQMSWMKWFDIPPVWLVGALIATYWLGQAQPFGLSLDHAITQFLAAVLIGGGLILMLLAIAEMRRKKTTVIPHLEADYLVQSGIFKRTRNPIYLGDVLILAGFILRWDAPLALPLIPALFWILETRFIVPEEDRLRRKFRQDLHRYAEKTRRWV